MKKEEIKEELINFWRRANTIKSIDPTCFSIDEFAEDWINREHLTNKESEEQPNQSVEEFLKMILNSYKVINEVDDYRKIHISIVQQAEILNNKLIDFR